MNHRRVIVWLSALLLLAIVGLLVVSRGPASALQGYRLDYHTVVQGVEDNLSGLAYDAKTGHLLAVVNRPETLLVLDTDGRILRRIVLHGFDDTEGVAIMHDGRIAVTEEGRNQITVFPMPAADVDQVDHAHAVTWPPVIGPVAGADHGNDGLEGLATDGVHGCLWAVKERKPRGLYNTCRWRVGKFAGKFVDVSGWLADAHAGTDLSGIERDPVTGHLLLLSDESARITELDRHGRVIGHRSLGGAGEPRPPQPEGIAVDGHGHVYVVSEPNLFYRYARD